jgi:DMSO/TMAO reductase YedYZ molybdopterin-dependent catalytic subunit
MSDSIPYPGAWLPPGQIPTDQFRVTGERAPSAEGLDIDRWRLIVDGLVEQPFTLSLPEVYALSTYAMTTDIHCVTGWSHRAIRFTGFPLAHILNRAHPRTEARFVHFLAYSKRGHDTSLPLEDARAETWIVTHADGQPLSVEHGFPARTLTPSRYLYKSLKWLHRIELLAEDRPGFWERTSYYHNNADPWTGDQRYTSGTMTKAQIERFRQAVSFERYRNEVVVSVDFSGWRPLTHDLRGVQIKNCCLQRADLRGADLRGANLTNSDLRYADLEGADLRDTDLEGVNFAGANLTNADFRSAIVNAARFFETSGDGTIIKACVTGLRREDAINLYPEQEAFLIAENSRGM